MTYENKSNRTLGENKPNQTQFVVSLPNLFQTVHLLVNRIKSELSNLPIKNSLTEKGNSVEYRLLCSEWQFL